MQAERDAQIALAEGKAKSIELVYEAEAQGLERLNQAQPTDQILRMKSIEAMKDIANVLNKDVDSLKLTDLITVLEKRPEDQKNLALQRDRLVSVADNVRRVNGQNQELLLSSLVSAVNPLMSFLLLII